MRYPFQAGGALLADSPVYVERKADHEALTHLRNMAYLLNVIKLRISQTSEVSKACYPPAFEVIPG